MRKPDFPIFMDPAEKYPVGSVEWAGRISSRACHEFEHVESYGIKPFLKSLLPACRGRAWKYWPPPPEPPWGDYQSWSQSLFELELEKIVAMIGEIDEVSERELLAIIADEQKGIRAGRPKDKLRNTKDFPGSEDVPYLLRRLARERPDLLEQYEQGELSARAASLEAGHVILRATIPTGMAIEALASQLRRRYRTAIERRRLAELLLEE
jgi:hypothetical protein